MTFGRMLGMYMIIPATIFLTISYFVLVVNSKLENKGLRSLGSLVAVLLWVCTALELLMGTMILVLGKPPIVQSIKAVLASIAM